MKLLGLILLGTLTFAGEPSKPPVITGPDQSLLTKLSLQRAAAERAVRAKEDELAQAKAQSDALAQEIQKQVGALTAKYKVAPGCTLGANLDPKDSGDVWKWNCPEQASPAPPAPKPIESPGSK